MCGTAGRAMRVERAPLKRAETVPGPPNLSRGPPAIPVPQPGLEHPRPPPCTGASRDATGASQVSDWESRSREVSGEGWSFRRRRRPAGWGPRRRSLQAVPRTFTLPFVFLPLSTDPGTVPRAPSHFSRLPLGGWAEDGQPASRHPEPVPEEGSEDELPPQVHKVRAQEQQQLLVVTSGGGGEHSFPCKESVSHSAHGALSTPLQNTLP